MSQAFISPKRKRVESSDHSVTPIKAPPLLTRFPPIPPEALDDGGGSPRTSVAGKFEDLAIGQYDLNQHAEHGDRPSKRAHYSEDEIMESSQELNDEPALKPQQTDGPADRHSTHPPMPPNSHAFTFFHPQTPTPAMATVFSNGQNITRSKSPSLKGEISDQYWHESEITGHDPDDPEDDGYGINGIGFKPTAGMAQERKVKRLRQIEGYRSREAREAREARIKSRRRSGMGSHEVKSKAALEAVDGALESPSKGRVRFREGGQEVA